MNIAAHLAEIEKLADAFAKPDGTEAGMALHALQLMRKSFITGALAASGLLIAEDVNIPAEWLKRHGLPAQLRIQ